MSTKLTSITRKEYVTEGFDSSVLSLPCKTITEKWDGHISAGSISFDDAFDVEEFRIDESTRSSSNASTHLMALSSEIAKVKLQPRLIPSAFTTPKVNGLQMAAMTETEITAKVAEEHRNAFKYKVGDDDKYFLFKADANYTSKASLGAVDDTFSWTDADGGHTFTRSELMVAVAECLGAAGVTGCVALGKMTEVVSILGEGMTDTEAMMDGRTSMAGYPVEGGSDVVWATVPYAQLMSMAQKGFKDTKVLTALLVALGMPSGMAKSECQLLSGGSLKEMTLNDGVLSSDTALQYGTDSLLACKAGSTLRPWIDYGIDGGSALVWEDNQCVFSLLAAMAKKTMDSLCGLALVGVGENGGVMSWMVNVNKKGVPFNKITTFASTYGMSIAKSTFTDKAFITFNNTSYFTTSITPTADMLFECVAKLNGNSFWQGIFGDSWAKGLGCLANGNNRFSCRINGSEKTIDTYDLTQKRTLKACAQYTMVDDARMNYGTAISTSNKMTIGCIPSLSSSRGFQGYIYAFRVYKISTGELLHWFVPTSDITFVDILGNETITKTGAFASEFGTE